MSFIDSLAQGYDQLWRSVIRPPRRVATERDLGPELFPVDCSEAAGLQLMVKRIKLELKLGTSLTKADLFVPLDQTEVSSQGHFPRPPDQRELVVYLHSQSANRAEGRFLVEWLAPHKISLLVWDFGGAGESSEQYLTMGVRETRELEVVCQQMRNNFGYEKIGLWGKSLGAVTSLYFAQRSQVSVLILDSPFDRLEQTILRAAKNRSDFPSFVISGGLYFAKNKIEKEANFDISKINPVEVVHNVSVPGFFIIGAEDHIIDLDSFMEMYSKFGAEKTIRVLPAGKHNDSRHDDPKLMEDAVEFLLKHLRQTSTAAISDFPNPYESLGQPQSFVWKPSVPRPVSYRAVLKLTGSSKSSHMPVLDVPSEKDTYHQSYPGTLNSSTKEYLTKVSTYIQPKTKCLRLLDTRHTDSQGESGFSSLRVEHPPVSNPLLGDQASLSSHQPPTKPWGQLQKTQNTWSEPTRITSQQQAGSLSRPAHHPAVNNFKSHHRFLPDKPLLKTDTDLSDHTKKHSDSSKPVSPRHLSPLLHQRISAPVHPSRVEFKDRTLVDTPASPRRLKLTTAHEKRPSSAFVRIFDSDSDRDTDYSKKMRLLEEGLLHFEPSKKNQAKLSLKAKPSIQKIAIQKPNFVGINPLKTMPIFAKPNKPYDSSHCSTPVSSAQFAPVLLTKPVNPLFHAFGKPAPSNDRNWTNQ